MRGGEGENALTVSAIPGVTVFARTPLSSEFPNERFTIKQEHGIAPASLDEGEGEEGTMYRRGVAFRPICDLEVSGAMRVAQSVTEAT